jgi:hypothetical protein
MSLDNPAERERRPRPLRTSVPSACRASSRGWEGEQQQSTAWLFTYDAGGVAESIVNDSFAA